MAILSKLDIRGNPKALARLLVSFACILVALVLGHVYQAQPAVVVGSFIGAALSLIVNWLVSQLETEKVDSVPIGFVAAAKSDVLMTGYYRDKQRIRFVIERDGEVDLLRLTFQANLIVVRDQVRIYHPDIFPPAGVKLKSSTYTVGDNQVQQGSFYTVDNDTPDELVVVYQVEDQAKEKSIYEVKDDHYWPSPILSYAVGFDAPSEEFVFEVSRIVAGSESETLRRRKARPGTSNEFFGNGAAFTTQGLRWRVSRVKRTDA